MGRGSRHFENAHFKNQFPIKLLAIQQKAEKKEPATFWGAKTLPHLREHLEMARSFRSRSRSTLSPCERDVLRRKNLFPGTGRSHTGVAFLS
jgi:hypothetical protein